MMRPTARLLQCAALFLMLQSPMLAGAQADSATPQALAQPTTMAREARATITEIEPAALQTMLQQEAPPLLVDVRTEKEYLAGHLRGATWVPRGKLEFAIGRLEDQADGDIVLYCRTGGRAALAAKTLQDMGYTNVRSLEGGFKQWVQVDYSIYNQHGEIRVLDFEADEAE